MSVNVVNRRGGRAVGLHAAAIFALAVVLAFSGAYDTDDLSAPHRLAMFSVICGLLIAQASLLDEWLRRFFGPGGLQLTLRGAATIMLTLVLMTLEVHALKFTPLLPKEPDPLLEFAVFLTPFVAAGAGLVVLFKAPMSGRIAQLRPIESGVERVLEISAHPVIAGLLPPPRALADWPAGTVQRVVSQDHYLEITTASGTVLLRGRMKDALARVSMHEGVRPHRSWWIAISEIKSIVRRGRDYELELADGSFAPVARARIKEIKSRLEAAGIG